MLAAMKGHAKCVDHLIYYKASLTAKDSKGMTARDHAVKSEALAPRHWHTRCTTTATSAIIITAVAVLASSSSSSS